MSNKDHPSFRSTGKPVIWTKRGIAYRLHARETAKQKVERVREVMRKRKTR